MWLSSVSPIEDKTKRPHFDTIECDWGRITGDAEHPHRTLISKVCLKNGRSAGNVAYMQKKTNVG
jgi:hypothetical protein